LKDSIIKELFILRIESKDLEHLLRRENQITKDNDDKFELIFIYKLNL
jgi:hypothetical protein